MAFSSFRYIMNLKNKLHIFIDESGDLGKLGSKYFTIAALCTKNPKPIENAMKRIKQRKISKRDKKISELKGNNSSKVIRMAVLNKLVKCDCTFNIITITKSQVKDYLYDHKEKLYNYIVGLVIKNMDIYTSDINLVIDKKTNNKLINGDLEQYIQKRIAEKKLLFKFKMTHKDSTNDRCLQAVDFVAWATNRKFSYGDNEYYDVIEEKISHFEKLWRESDGPSKTC